MHSSTAQPRLLRSLLAALVACALGAAAAAPARAATLAVDIPAAAYDPATLTAVSGDTVTWTNHTLQLHAITARDVSFTSGPLSPGGAYSTTFTTGGSHPYFCPIHLFMQGEVDVVAALLSAASDQVTAGGTVALTGRAPAGTGTVGIESAPAGTSAFAPVATVPAAPDGTFAATVAPAESSTYRAVVAAGASQPVTIAVQRNVKLLLSARVAPRTARLRVHVLPARPGARVVLQLYDRWRYAWVPFASARLDRGSRASFTVPTALRERARVVLPSAAGDQVSNAVRTWSARPRRR